MTLKGGNWVIPWWAQKKKVDFNREPTARERQRTPRSDKERLELFNLNRAPRAREIRERQGVPENALERLGL